MKTTTKMIGLLLDMVLVGIVAVYAITLLLAPEPTMKQIASLLAITSLMVCNQYMVAKNTQTELRETSEFRKIAKLVEGQNAILILEGEILKELKAGNEKNTALVVSQAELLSKLTSSVVKKKVESKAEAKIPAVGLTAEEVAAVKKVAERSNG
jgi:hypothetical protein